MLAIAKVLTKDEMNARRRSLYLGELIGRRERELKLRDDHGKQARRVKDYIGCQRMKGKERLEHTASLRVKAKVLVT